MSIWSMKLSDVRFGHELANQEFLITKLPRRERFGHSVITTVSLVAWQLVILRIPQKLCFLPFENFN
jgi:hypothetical protein